MPVSTISVSISMDSGIFVVTYGHQSLIWLSCWPNCHRFVHWQSFQAGSCVFWYVPFILWSFHYFLVPCDIPGSFCMAHVSLGISHFSKKSQFLLLNNGIYFQIYLFLAALSLHCCTRAFSSYGERGVLFIMCGLVAVASLVAEHRL